ncbi:MAG TPA: MFS transporter [Nannocystaceae bacterium]|nr:MFS transporter [Nannocystaceae bacterium]
MITIRSLVPARMDRLPWSGFHWRVVIALGITWVLEGIEIGLASAMGDTLRSDETLGLSAEIIGISAGVFLFGEVVGALYFGRKADKLGRRRLFIVTLALYLIANAMTALSWTTWFFVATRFFAGMGIGGEYAAIHSAIDELTPAKYRGRVDIAVAGTYWGGAMIAAATQLVLLDPSIVPIDWGWRIALLLGPVIGLSIWPLRTFLPESPRWQLTHGHDQDAEQTVARIEADLHAKGVVLAEVDPAHAIVLQRHDIGLLEVGRVLATKYLRRVFLGASLMITQSFLYNAIFFTYVLILRDFYDVPSKSVGWYIFPFAAGNLLGPFVIGRFFDTIGRRKMIAATYCTAAGLLAITAWLFSRDLLTAETQTMLWCAIFFIASAAASSAYLTVSEIFPVEIRAQSIALLFAISQGVGAMAPAILGAIIGAAKDPATGEVVTRTPLALAYFGSAAIMCGGGIVAWFFGVDAEQRSLEDVAPPVTAVASPHVTPAEAPAGPHPHEV